MIDTELFTLLIYINSHIQIKMVISIQLQSPF